MYCTTSIVFSAQEAVGCYTVAARQAVGCYTVAVRQAVGCYTVGIADPLASTRAVSKLALDCKG